LWKYSRHADTLSVNSCRSSFAHSGAAIGVSILIGVRASGAENAIVSIAMAANLSPIIGRLSLIVPGSA
jgi:hypothetical protein